MSSATSHATLSRSTSVCSDVINLSTSWAAVILWPSAIVVLLLRRTARTDRRFEAPGGRPSSGTASSSSYTTSTDSTLEAPEFHLVPLGAQHNESDHAAWTSSIAHIRATPGFESWGWPPVEGMSVDANRGDLERHARDFAERT